jgi:DNA-binding transcriptional ArsR family regulator
MADDTGRAIFTTICQKRIISPSDLERILGISLPLVNWHVKRLMDVGLIRIEKLGTSQKNKPVKYYGPATTIIIIGVDLENDEESSTPLKKDDAFLQLRKKKAIEAIWSRLTKSMKVGIISFVAGTSLIYTIRNMLGITKDSIFIDPTTNNGIKLADPDAISPSLPPPDPLLSLFYGSLPPAIADFVIALLGGFIIGVVAFVAMRMVVWKTRVKP